MQLRWSCNDAFLWFESDRELEGARTSAPVVVRLGGKTGAKVASGGSFEDAILDLIAAHASTTFNIRIIRGPSQEKTFEKVPPSAVERVQIPALLPPAPWNLLTLRVDGTDVHVTKLPAAVPIHSTPIVRAIAPGSASPPASALTLAINASRGTWRRCRARHVQQSSVIRLSAQPFKDSIAPLASPASGILIQASEYLRAHPREGSVGLLARTGRWGAGATRANILASELIAKVSRKIAEGGTIVVLSPTGASRSVRPQLVSQARTGATWRGMIDDGRTIELLRVKTGASILSILFLRTPPNAREDPVTIEVDGEIVLSERESSAPTTMLRAFDGDVILRSVRKNGRPCSVRRVTTTLSDRRRSVLDLTPMLDTSNLKKDDTILFSDDRIVIARGEEEVEEEDDDDEHASVVMSSVTLPLRSVPGVGIVSGPNVLLHESSEDDRGPRRVWTLVPVDETSSAATLFAVERDVVFPSVWELEVGARHIRPLRRLFRILESDERFSMKPVQLADGRTLIQVCKFE